MQTLVEHIEEKIAPGIIDKARPGIIERARPGIMAEIILEQLRGRFKRLPKGVPVRVRNASAEELRRWGRRLLDAKRLDEVFAE